MKYWDRTWRVVTGGSLANRGEHMYPKGSATEPPSVTQGTSTQSKHTGSQNTSLLEPSENWNLSPGA